MTLKEKYADTLKVLDDEPEYNRKRAIKRFFLLKDLQDNFFPLQKLLLGPKLSFTKALVAYSKLRGVSVQSLFRWQGNYKKHGIKGLLSKYGTTLGKNSVVVKKHKFTATITIDTREPLKCLESIRRIIERCRFIKPDIKETSLSLLKRYFSGLIHGSPLTLSVPLTDEEIKALNHYKASSHKKHSKKATVLLLANDGRTLIEVMEATHMAATTIYHWLSNFNRDRLESIKVHVHSPNRERIKAERQTRVIDIIHKLPSLYGINRTSWTYGAICEAYRREYGAPISKEQISDVIKNTGYSWRHARMVLTSPDPEYKKKVERILDVLQGLKEDERFFFIDEVGPYRVKKYGGQRLSLKDQVEVIPAQQKGRGKVQFVAALEAVTNQLTWRFTADKSAFSMVSFIEKLVTSYDYCSAIYLTWDAISVHNSKAVREWIEAHNKATKQPHIEVVPLPSNAQFLNVIEAVFCGMKKAVICNSDYANPAEMQDAITRHFEARNQFYRDNPKRAGNKIWDKEAFDLEKLPGGLFRRM